MKLTKDQLKSILKKGNVTLDYEHSILAKKHPGPVAGLLPAEPEPSVGRELQTAPQAQKGGEDGLRFRVLIVRCGRRLLDDDNLAASFKHVRDGIALELGIDDGDPAIEWEYGQVRTRGAVGTIIRIERL